MATQKQQILSTFNNQFMEFVEDIHTLFPDDIDVLTTKNTLALIKKSNPKLIIKVWQTEINAKYKDNIDNGDIDFFLNKDYKDDIWAPNSEQILEAINRLRAPLRNLSEDERRKTIKYLQNLKKIAEIYFAIDN
jgi:hypothetical protein